MYKHPAKRNTRTNGISVQVETVASVSDRYSHLRAVLCVIVRKLASTFQASRSPTRPPRQSNLIVVVVGSFSVVAKPSATGVKRAGQVDGHKEDVARAVKAPLKKKKTQTPKLAWTVAALENAHENINFKILRATRVNARGMTKFN